MSEQLAQYQESAYRQDKPLPIEPPGDKARQAFDQFNGVKLPWSQHYSQLTPPAVIESGLTNTLSLYRKERLITHQRWGIAQVPWYGYFFQSLLMLLSAGLHTFLIVAAGLVIDVYFTLTQAVFFPGAPSYLGLLLIGLFVRYFIAPVIPPGLTSRDVGVGLYRETGVVKLMHQGQLATFPFVDFECVVLRHPARQGLTISSLNLVHRYKPDIRLRLDCMPVGGDSDACYFIAWDMLQRYMDVTQPLPDIPQLEAFRHLDPRTQAYDKAHPEKIRAWKKTTLAQWKRSHEKRALAEAISAYPWDAPCRLAQNTANRHKTDG